MCLSSRGGVALGSAAGLGSEGSKRLTETDRQTLELLAVVLSSAVGRANEFEALARFEAVYRGAPIGIGILSLDGRITQANDNMLAITGHSSTDDLATEYVANYTHEDDKKLVVEPFLRMVAGEFDSFQVEARTVRKDGSVVWSASAISLVRDAEGNPLFAIDMAQDITDRKLAEIALRENGVRLARIVETQNEAARAGSDLDQVTDITVARTLELTKAEGVTISFLEGDDLVVRASSGNAKGKPGERRPLADSIVSAAVESGGLLIEDAQGTHG